MKVVKYHFEFGVFTAILAAVGRKHAVLVPMTAFGETGMKVIKVPVREVPRMKTVEYKGREYPIKRAITKFRAAYRKFGGTKGVKAALYG